MPKNRQGAFPLICLIAAEFVSQVGNQIAAIAIPILVLQFTHSSTATGIAGAGNIIPIVLAAFVGGKLIDRFGVWRVSVVADVLSGFSVMLLPFMFIAFKSVSPIVIFGLVFAGALFDPTAVSARHILVPKFSRLAGVSLDKVNGYRGSLENGADLLGPVVGAGLVSWIGAVDTLFMNAVSFFICAVLFAIAVPRLRQQFVKSEGTKPIAGIHPQRNGTQFCAAAISRSFTTSVSHSEIFCRTIGHLFSGIWHGSDSGRSILFNAYATIFSLNHLL
jgi:predicted MFS family arabinose efflux permease